MYSLSRRNTGLISNFALFVAKIENINGTSKKNNKKLRIVCRLVHKKGKIGTVPIFQKQFINYWPKYVNRPLYKSNFYIKRVPVFQVLHFIITFLLVPSEYKIKFTPGCGEDNCLPLRSNTAISFLSSFDDVKVLMCLTSLVPFTYSKTK